MSRPLEDRLREYANAQRETADGLLATAKAIELVRQDVNPETQGIRDTAKLLTVVADDIDKILAGDELRRWAITGELPT